LSVASVLRAPKDDGAVLAEPPLERVGELIAANRKRLAAVDAKILGMPWDLLRESARRDAWRAAWQYLWRPDQEAPAHEPPESLVVAGHQPELFHPGVWAKNFALAGIARRHGVSALNLVVDNDTVKSTSLRLPSPATAAVRWPHTVTSSFDRWTGEVPYEERPILDSNEFSTFAERAGGILSAWDYKPLLASFWAEALAESRRSSLLGEVFAAARRTFERRWGCYNLELPVSQLCQTNPFARFACHILSELPRFHAIYNECVHDYRRSHGIRSRNHPVPDLATDGDWLEMPFWGWRADRPRRGRLFARRGRGGACGFELRVDGEVWGTLPSASCGWLHENGTRERGGDVLVDAWQQLRGNNYKIRCRALTNTLYSRLFLGDLFVHGIGGGKYDELTDAIIRRFYGIEPPAFIVLTATRLLPLPHFPATADTCHGLQREVRDMHWNPQRHLPANAPSLQELVRARAELVRQQPADKAGRRERFKTLRQISEKLRVPLAGEERRLRDDLETCAHQVEANGVLSRRDYSFVLYPEETLRPFCEQFL
jgi:hypothetical protein